MKHWILPAMALVLAACAGTPEPKDTTVAAASVPSATNVPAAGNGTAPAVAETATASGVESGSGSMQVRTDEPTVAKSRPGYRARQRGGETVWCRKETPTGSRMPVENCYSAAQLDAIDADAETMKDSINSTRQRCSGASCSNGS